MFQKRKPRVKVALKAVLDAGPRCETVGIEDLSESGAFVALDAEVAPGDAFTLIPLDEDALPAVRVTVVRAQMPADTDIEAKRPRGVGLTFSFADAESEAQLRAFCAGQREAAVRRLRGQPRFHDAASTFERSEAIPLAVALPRVQASRTVIPQRAVPAPVLGEPQADAPWPVASAADAPNADDIALDAFAPSTSVVFDVPNETVVDTAPVASVSQPWPTRVEGDEQLETRFFDAPTDVVGARIAVAAASDTHTPSLHAASGDDPFLAMAVTRLKRWLGALAALQVVLMGGAVAVYLDHAGTHAEEEGEQAARLAALSAEQATGQARRAAQDVALQAASRRVEELAEGLERNSGPALRHVVDVQRLSGSDKAAVGITRIIDSPKLRDAHVDFIRTRVFRAQIDEHLVSARRGLTDLKAGGLTWVAMRDDIVPCPGADLAPHDLSTALQKRLAASAPHTGCGALVGGGEYQDEDLFLVAVAPKAAIQVVTDVGVRFDTPDGAQALTLAERTVRVVP